MPFSAANGWRPQRGIKRRREAETLMAQTVSGETEPNRIGSQAIQTILVIDDDEAIRPVIDARKRGLPSGPSGRWHDRAAGSVFLAAEPDHS
jgi:hypothetical protein